MIAWLLLAAASSASTGRVHEAVQADELGAPKQALDEGEDINARGHGGQSPLSGLASRAPTHLHLSF